jgi:ubiquinone/menaquinone biosynthesis C-methylase UbiE
MDYDDLADRYDQRYARYEYGGVEGCVLRFTHGAADVLEVGCGTGHWLELLAREAGSDRHPTRLSGVDPSLEMLKQARARAPHARVVQGRAEALPFADASFDRVMCVNAFHHFSDKHAFIAEARRVLRPHGGLLVCGLDPHTGHERWWIYDYYANALARDRERFSSSAAILAMLAHAGFTRAHSSEVHRFASQHDAHDALERGLLDQHTTSQLALLDAAEYAAGIERLRGDIAAAKKRDESLILQTDLRLHGVTAWVE